jgi:hypothetical protein
MVSISPELADFPDADRRRGEAAAIAAAIALADHQLRVLADQHTSHLLVTAEADYCNGLTLALPTSLLHDHIQAQRAQLASNHRLLLAEIATLEKSGTDGLARAAAGFTGPVTGFRDATGGDALRADIAALGRGLGQEA